MPEAEASSLVEIAGTGKERRGPKTKITTKAR